MTYDVAIIGAGMSGLAAGIRLAYYDKKVCILEKHSRIGGLNSYYSRGGYDLDVGLHAITNYVDRSEKSKPLMRLLRQLKIGYDELDLSEQIRSAVKFNDRSLHFSNDFNLLETEVAKKFPKEIYGFMKLKKYVEEFNALVPNADSPNSARGVMSSYIDDPLLTDMLLCPLMFYGNPKEDDMDFWQFVIMFESIFLEGFSRPYEGVRRILRILKDKYTGCGGELFLNSGVEKIIPAKSGRIDLRLINGDVISAKKVLSSAGYPETMRLVSEKPVYRKPTLGKMSFMESVYVLDRDPKELGIDSTIIFFSSGDKFDYRKPDGLIDETSGVICCPNNFKYDTPLKDNIVRVTNISNPDLWEKDDDEAYKKQKEECMALSLKEAERYTGSIKGNIVFTDSFTPRTIERYTSHINGAVYGAEDKKRDGMTSVEGLYLCGTDQGFLGIIGAMLSGISMANLHLLK